MSDAKISDSGIRDAGITVRRVHGIARQRAALALLFNTSDVEPILAEMRTSANSEAGLFEAFRDTLLVGGVWVKIEPGDTAIVWPPKTMPADDPLVGVALMRTALTYSQQAGAKLAQMLLDRNDAAAAKLLEAVEFPYLADLVYLVSLDSEFPREDPQGSLEFEPYSHGINHERLMRVVESTYADTLDCPELDGVRSVDDVLEGYKAAGTFDPARWLLVRHAGEDAGCLLLTEHRSAQQHCAQQHDAETEAQEPSATVALSDEQPGSESCVTEQNVTEQRVTEQRVTEQGDSEQTNSTAARDRSVHEVSAQVEVERPTWELVYMGLVPAARGHGLAEQVVRYAQWLAAKAGCSRLVLAVDSRNHPAIRCYERAGFLEWDRRAVHLKIFNQP